MQSSPRSILYLAALGVALLYLFPYRDYVVDDTYINLRYAQHLVEGHGLVFNPGERIEGYTNISIVLLAALFLTLGIEPVLGLKIFTGVMGICVLFLVSRLENMMSDTSAKPAVPLSILFLLPTGAFVYWAVCPMGTMLFTALLLAALAVTFHETITETWRGSGLVFALLAITRPEGLYVFGVSTAVFSGIEYLHRRTWDHLRRHIGNVVIVTVLVGAYLTWRYAYYGNVLPNTYYAKVTGGAGHLITGLSYLRDWLSAFPLFGATLLAPLALVAASVRARLLQPILPVALYVITLAYVLSVVAVGGDFMPFFRFFVPIMPLCALLVVSGFRMLPLSSRVTGPVLFAAVAVHALCATLTEQPYRAFVAHRTAILGREVGEWFANRQSPSDLIAVNTAGSLPYYSRLPTIDMLGLTDARIARRPIFIVSEGWAGHRRGWGAYVLERRPRIILWYNSVGAAEPFYLSDHELADDALFRFFYRLRSTILPALSDDTDGRVVTKRFLGFPFGFSGSGDASMEDLGLIASFRDGMIDLTTLSEGPIRVTYFELDPRDGPLWEDGFRLRHRLRTFVDVVAERWEASAPEVEPEDPTAAAEVDALCATAQRLIAGGDHHRARVALEAAASRNHTVRSPLVYQYTANLAVLTGQLFTALAAQKEALRLAPENQLYRDNLHHLLTASYKEFGRDRPEARRNP